MLAFPLLYKEVEVLAAALGNWRLTPVLRALEVRLFRGHPSLYLSQEFPSVLLSEYLHFCYLSYLLLLPLIGGYWYATCRKQAFHELFFLAAVTYGCSYLFFVLFSVDSPFYLSDPPGGPVAGNFFYELVHFVSSRGGARGGAFPSAHASITTVVWLVAWRYHVGLAVWMTPLVVGIWLATLYGRFHYGLVLIAGVFLAALVVGSYSLFSRVSPSRDGQ